MENPAISAVVPAYNMDGSCPGPLGDRVAAALVDDRTPPPPAQRVPMHGLIAIDFLEKGGLPDGESGDQRDHSGL